MIRGITVLAGLLVAFNALAHTKLATSVPAADASVPALVAEIVLEFAGNVRLTAVTLTDTSGAEKMLGALPKDVAERFVIAVEEQPLPLGEYVITWRAVGADTHVISGEIRFTASAT